MPPKPKPVFKTSSPFTEAQWPKLSTEDCDNIVHLLSSLLQPIGDHRRQFLTPSKGKSKKRKRTANPTPSPSTDNIPPPPKLSSHILVGLNSVTRHVEALAAKTAPETLSGHQARDDEEKDQPTPLSMVVIPHPSPPSSLPHAHIPTLIHLANLKSKLPTILLTLPTQMEHTLSTALHIPHVGALAIKEGAPGANALVTYVREHVGVTECPWIDEAAGAVWKGTRVEGR